MSRLGARTHEWFGHTRDGNDRRAIVSSRKSGLQRSFLKVIVKVKLNPRGTNGDFSVIGQSAETERAVAGGPIFGCRDDFWPALKL
jgi:hypothetical protein